MFFCLPLPDMDKKLFLIDGHSLIFRMYYAFFRRPMINSKGRDVSILFGFTKYILELIARKQPTHIAVAFDPPGKTFRHQMYAEYKANRSATPELVIEALEPLIELCGAMGIPVLMKPGFEGDDVLGSMAVQAAEKGYEVYMVTPDKDFGQLVSERIFQLKPGKSGGEDEVVGVPQLCEKLGITSPSQVIDMLTICGDAADNVPGVKGIGEVGAAKLISKYGSVEGIYEHLGELSAKQAQLMEEARSHVELSKQLVTIKTDIELEIDDSTLAVRTEHGQRLSDLFDMYEFNSLRKLVKINAEQTPELQAGFLKWTNTDVESICSLVRDTKECAICAGTLGDGIFAQVTTVVVAISTEDGCYLAHGQIADFREILSDGNIRKYGLDLKDCHSLLLRQGVRLGGKLCDIELMHYVLSPETSHKLDILSRSYLDININAGTQQDEAQVAELSLFETADEESAAGAEADDMLLRQCAACAMLGPALLADLRKNAQEILYFQIEEPLIRVLSRMELAGVKVDMTSLREYAGSLEAEMTALAQKIRTAAGKPDMNLSSPRQIGAWLYDDLRIDPRKKAGSAQSTDEDTLLDYAENFPVIYDILEFRTVKKLLNTYIEPFAGFVSPVDGRVHTTFNQALTSTGRLSSARPNLQNIPIRTERGRNIRRAFVASSPDKVIVSADYSQIELRLMAHFCGDDNMRDAFCLGKDVHAITASKIFGVPLEEVTPDMRRTAKTANFGIMYGISAFGLAQRLKIPRVAAKKIIEDYFTSFPKISQWIESTVADARRLGYVQTLCGRRRYLPDINSRNQNVRALAERNAVNAPLQGTAADIIKMAMIRVDQRLRRSGMQTLMVLQIHDELVFEAPRSELEELKLIIKQEMEGVISLSVPLTVECNYGENWLEAH